MKKLMFGAAVAATGMTFAANPAAQVYDVALSIKTTAPVKGVVKNAFADTAPDKIVYRKQASKTWKGLIWGCDCETIDGVWGKTATDAVKGCVVWDTKGKQPVFLGSGFDFTDFASVVDGEGFGWDFINAIDKSGKKVEGAWNWTQYGKACDDPVQLFDFRGAGFGTLTLLADCSSRIASINGNFAGWMQAPNGQTDDLFTGCLFCGYEAKLGDCEFSTAWDYCDCAGLLDDTRTAAYGTWSVKYNAGLSAKLGSENKLVASITEIYKFPKDVQTAVEAAEVEVLELPIGDCEALQAALDAARAVATTAQEKYDVAKAEYDLALTKDNTAATNVELCQTNVAEAQKAFDAVTPEALAADLKAATLAYTTASNKWDASVKAVDAADELVKAAQKDYDKDFFQVYTNEFKVYTYDTFGQIAPSKTYTVAGFDGIMAAIPTDGLGYFSINSTEGVLETKRVDWSFPDTFPVSCQNTKDNRDKVAAKVNAMKSQLAKSSETLDAQKAAFEAAKTARDTAATDRDEKKEALNVAQSNYDNRVSLLIVAQTALSAAQTDLAKAELVKTNTAAALATAEAAEEKAADELEAADEAVEEAQDKFDDARCVEEEAE